MTNSELTQLLVVVDRSGSMMGIKNDMIGGLDSLFKDQAKEPGKCVVDYVQFDTQYELVYSDRDASEARAVLQPRGGTALLDAIGKSVTQLGEKLVKADEDERPGTVVVVVVTDGHENSSHEWTKDAVAALIKQQEEKWNWNFTFLGANMDAVAVGASFGFNPDSSMTYNGASVGAMTASLTNNVTRTRSGLGNSYTAEEREQSNA